MTQMTFADLNLNHALRRMGGADGNSLVRETKRDVQPLVVNALMNSRGLAQKELFPRNFTSLTREQTLEFVFRGGMELVFRSWPDNAAARRELQNGTLPERTAMAVVLLRSKGHTGFSEFRALFDDALLAEVEEMGLPEFTWQTFHALGSFLDRRDRAHAAGAPRRARLTGGAW